MEDKPFIILQKIHAAILLVISCDFCGVIERVKVE